VIAKPVPPTTAQIASEWFYGVAARRDWIRCNVGKRLENPPLEFAIDSSNGFDEILG
jgi:hypothetical protein